MLYRVFHIRSPVLNGFATRGTGWHPHDVRKTHGDRFLYSKLVVVVGAVVVIMLLI